MSNIWGLLFFLFGLVVLFSPLLLAMIAPMPVVVAWIVGWLCLSLTNWFQTYLLFCIGVLITIAPFFIVVGIFLYPTTTTIFLGIVCIGMLLMLKDMAGDL